MNHHEKITVLTYNIHSCVGSDGEYSPTRIAHVLKQVDADIVCLQEVEVNLVRQKTRIWSSLHEDDQVARIADEAGFTHSKFGKAITCVASSSYLETIGQGDGEFGVAILSKWPILDHKILAFAPFSNKTPRNALACLIEIPSCENDTKVMKVWVVCTHLGCNFGGSEQLQQANELAVFLRNLLEMSDYVLLGGDFNSPNWFAAIHELKKVLTDASCPGKGTFPATGCFWGSMKLDYILYNSPGLTCSETEVHLDGAVASDHLPFSASFSVEASKGRIRKE